MTCKIEITFPQVMKMIMCEQFDVDPSISLKDLQKKVFEIFWGRIENIQNKHGKANMTVFKAQDSSVIDTDEKLRALLGNTAKINLKVSFEKHP